MVRMGPVPFWWLFAALSCVLVARGTKSCEEYTGADCPTDTGCKIANGACAIDYSSIKGCSDYTTTTCPTGKGCVVKNSACEVDTTSVKGCADYTEADCPTDTGCVKTDGKCGLNIAVLKGCTDYTETDCPNTGCIVKASACTYKTCEDYENTTCPDDGFCEVKSGTCGIKGCSSYEESKCPTSTGCVVSGGKCGLPGDLSADCTIDYRWGCSDYTASCCPTSTGCSVVGDKCSLAPPPDTCTLNVNAGCSGYTYECCPVSTGCAKLSGKCVLPGSVEGCPKEILSCSGYSAACCPTSTGCEISGGKCQLQTFSGKQFVGKSLAPVTAQSRTGCLNTCLAPDDSANLVKLCAYINCLTTESSCATIVDALQGDTAFGTAMCSCGRPKVTTFIGAFEGQGDCSSADKEGEVVDLCKATGKCKTAIKAGVEVMNSEDSCTALLAAMSSQISKPQFDCASAWFESDTDSDTPTPAPKVGTASGVPEVRLGLASLIVLPLTFLSHS